VCSSLLGLLLSLGRDAAAAAAAADDDDDVFVESCAADSCMKPDGELLTNAALTNVKGK